MTVKEEASTTAEHVLGKPEIGTIAEGLIKSARLDLTSTPEFLERLGEVYLSKIDRLNMQSSWHPIFFQLEGIRYSVDYRATETKLGLKEGLYITKGPYEHRVKGNCFEEVGLMSQKYFGTSTSLDGEIEHAWTIYETGNTERATNTLKAIKEVQMFLLNFA